MASTEGRNRCAPTTSATDAAFDFERFERFEWEGPDRPEVSIEVALHEARAAAEAAGAEARRLHARIEAIRDALGEETRRP